MIVVADASPLIAVARIGRLDLLRSVFGQLLVPDAVWREVVEAGEGKAGTADVAAANWIERRAVVKWRVRRRDVKSSDGEEIEQERQNK